MSQDEVLVRDPLIIVQLSAQGQKYQPTIKKVWIIEASHLTAFHHVFDEGTHAKGNREAARDTP